MSKAPSYVPRTSGQGVSRYAYQKAYSLGFHGTGAPDPAKGVAALKTNESALEAPKQRVANRSFMAPKISGGTSKPGETWETFSKRVKK